MTETGELVGRTFGLCAWLSLIHLEHKMHRAGFARRAVAGAGAPGLLAIRDLQATVHAPLVSARHRLREMQHMAAIHSRQLVADLLR